MGLWFWPNGQNEEARHDHPSNFPHLQFAGHGLRSGLCCRARCLWNLKQGLSRQVKRERSMVQSCTLCTVTGTVAHARGQRILDQSVTFKMLQFA